MRQLLFITGFLSSSVQFILLREISCISGNSEISTAIYLAMWLVISSAGAIPSITRRGLKTGPLMAMLVASPPLSVIIFILAGSFLINPGEVLPTPGLLILLFFTLAPVTLISVSAFVRLAMTLASDRSFQPGNSFGIETLGSILAGLAATFSALIFIPGFQYLFIITTISALWSAIIIFRPTMLKRLLLFYLPAALIILLVSLFPPDLFIRSIQLRDISVDKSFDTPYGNITTGTYNGDETVYYNFHPLFYSNDEISREEDIHYAMLQNKNVSDVLLISGGLHSHLEEIIKYKPVRIDYTEADPGLLRVEESMIMPDYEKSAVNIIKKDAFRYLLHSKKRYDVIIQLTDQPLTLSMNRFYSSEYFRAVKNNLSDGGVFACSPLNAYNYASENYLSLLSSIVKALEESFSNVLLIRGEKLYLIASDHRLTTEICRLANERGIDNLYVNCSYLNDYDISQRSREMMSVVNRDIRTNRLANPVASWYGNRLNEEKNGSRRSYAVILSLLILLPLFWIKRRAVLMFTSSASLAGLGMIVIFVFQAAYGNAHLLSALVLSVLFAGLATGASFRYPTRIRSSLYPVILALLMILTGVLSLLLMPSSGNTLLFLLLPLLVFSSGFITGSFFRSATRMKPPEETAIIYSADLSGSASGYLVTGTLLIPLTGILFTTLILSSLILISLSLVSVRSKL